MHAHYGARGVGPAIVLCLVAAAIAGLQLGRVCVSDSVSSSVCVAAFALMDKEGSTSSTSEKALKRPAASFRGEDGDHPMQVVRVEDV